MLKHKSLNNLNQVLNTKALELSDKLPSENMRLWLQNNWMENKNEVMTYVDEHMSSNDEVFEKRLTKYVNYFSVLEKETDEKKRVEYVFNYLTGILAQLLNYVSNK